MKSKLIFAITTIVCTIFNLSTVGLSFALEEQPVPTPILTVDQLGATDNIAGTQVQWSMPEDSPIEFYGFVLQKKLPNNDRVELANYYPDDFNDYGYYMDDYVDMGQTYTYYVQAYVRSSSNPDDSYHHSPWAEQTITLEPIKFIDVKVEPSTTSAKITFSTDYEAKCTIKYGTSVEYGQSKDEPTANDPNYIDHEVYLTDLTPETIYHYKIVGVVDNGTDDGQTIEYGDQTFATRGGASINLSSSGRWMDNYKGEITFRTDRLVVALLKWRKSGETVYQEKQFTSPAKDFRHEIVVLDESTYEYSIDVETPDDTINPVLTDSAIGSFDTPAIVIEEATIIPEGNDYRVNWQTNIPSHGKVRVVCDDIYGSCVPEDAQFEKTEEEYNLTQSIVITKEELLTFQPNSTYYSAEVFAYGKSNNEKNRLTNGISFQPFAIYNNSHVIELTSPSSQKHRVTFTWRTTLEATGIVQYSGPVSGMVNCGTADTTCTALANDLIPGTYTYTIRADASEEGWPIVSKEGSFIIGSSQFTVVASYVDSDTPFRSHFTLNAYPQGTPILAANIRGVAHTEVLNSSGVSTEYNRCPVSGSGTADISFDISCIGTYNFWGEATIKDGVRDIIVTINFAPLNTTCINPGGFAGGCPTFGWHDYFATYQKYYTSPTFSGFGVEYPKDIAFPWLYNANNLGEFIETYRPGWDGSSWVQNRYLYAVWAYKASPFQVGDPPVRTIETDQIHIYEGEPAPRSGENVFGPPFSNCPGSIVQVQRYSYTSTYCKFIWP